MEQVKNQDILVLIDKLAEHYNNNIANRFVRPAFYKLVLDKLEWDTLESITSKNPAYKYQGFHLDELYFKILALAKFVSQARQHLQPNIKALVLAASAGGRPGATSTQDKILAEMAGNNFPSNLKVLSDLINELFIKTTQIDTAMHLGKTPLYQKMPELKEIGVLLVGN